jgi:hypothetical protein
VTGSCEEIGFLLGSFVEDVRAAPPQAVARGKHSKAVAQSFSDFLGTGLLSLSRVKVLLGTR